jgi:multidrug resistance efflux pump
MSENKQANSTPSRPQQDTGEVVDILRIEPVLARLAEAPGEPLQRVESIFKYLLRLLNGYSIFLQEVSKEVVPRVQVWQSPDSGFRETVLKGTEPYVLKAASEKRAELGQLAAMPGYYVISIPWIHGGKIRGVVTLVLAAQSRESLQSFLAVLQSALGFLHYGLFRDEALDGLKSVEQTAAYVELTSKVASAPFYDEAVRLLGDQLRKHLGCGLVAIARVKGKARRGLSMEAMSGSVHFDRRGIASTLLESAMRDVLHADGAVMWPRPEGDIRGGASLFDVAHQELHHSQDLEIARSWPLRDEEGRIVAVLTLLWEKGQQPIAVVERFLEAALPHLGIFYTSLRRSDPMALRKWWHHGWRRVSRVKRILIGLVLVAVVIILAWPVAYPVRANTSVEPVIRRVVSAQFDGVLEEAMVEPGQLVEAGELLAVMDDKRLTWREAELVAKRDRALRERDLAMTDKDAEVAAAQMASLEAEGFGIELQVLAFERENLELRAPIRGMVLVGDLERAKGVPVSQGDVLFEIGSLETVIAELQVRASDISLIAEGDSLSIRLASFPEHEWSGVLQKIHPQSSAVDGGNYFVAEASLETLPGDPLLRAGMQGRAKIRGERVPLAWVLTRRLWDYLHLKFFW